MFLMTKLRVSAMTLQLIEQGKDGQPTREITVNQSEFLIGRGPDCNLILHDSAISRHHCIIRLAKDEATLVDLGSSNGTYCNGQRVRSQIPLHSGHLIAVGDFRFRVDVGDQDSIDLGKLEQENQNKATIKLHKSPEK